MSTSRQEIQDLNRDELVDLVLEMQREIERIDNMVLGLYEGQIPTIRKELEDTKESINDVRETAETAQARARISAAEATKKQPTKLARTKSLIRNRLVKDTFCKGNEELAALSTSQVSEMAEPEMFVDNRTILDAMDELSQEFGCFAVERGDPGPHGDDTLIKSNGGKMEAGLLRTVADTLTDERVNESLIMKAEEKGGR